MPRGYNPLQHGGDHLSSPIIADRIMRSTRDSNATSRGSSLLDLAPGGGCLAAHLAMDAGGLLHHRFTLAASPKGRAALRFSVALFQQVASLRALPGAALCGERTFLDPSTRFASGPRSPGSLEHRKYDSTDMSGR